MPTLCLLNDDGALLQQWEIGHKPITVGRGAAADVKIDDEALSRRHFTIYREGDEVWIRDLSSRNGTWVDGTRVLTAKLQGDERILAGCTQFSVHDRRVLETNGFEAAKGPHDTAVVPVGVF